MPSFVLLDQNTTIINTKRSFCFHLQCTISWHSKFTIRFFSTRIRRTRNVNSNIFCVNYTKDGIYVGNRDTIGKQWDHIRKAWSSGEINVNLSKSLPDLRYEA